MTKSESMVYSSKATLSVPFPSLHTIDRLATIPSLPS